MRHTSRLMAVTLAGLSIPGSSAATQHLRWPSEVPDRFQTMRTTLAELAGKASHSPYLDAIPRAKRQKAIQDIMARRAEDEAVIQSAVKCGYLTESDQTKFTAAYAELALYPTDRTLDHGKLFEHWMSSVKSLTDTERNILTKIITSKQYTPCSK